MKTTLKVFLVLLSIIIIVVDISSYIYLKPKQPSYFENPALVETYKVLADEPQWRSKLVASDNPEEWQIADKQISIISKGYHGEFYCGDKKAEFHKYKSYSNPAYIGAGYTISIIDCEEYYFIFSYADNGPKLYGSFTKGGDEFVSEKKLLSVCGKTFTVAPITIEGREVTKDIAYLADQEFLKSDTKGDKTLCYWFNRSPINEKLETSIQMYIDEKRDSKEMYIVMMHYPFMIDMKSGLVYKVNEMDGSIGEVLGKLP